MSIPNEKDVSQRIEELAGFKDMTYVDAVIQVSEEIDIDPDCMSAFLSKPIKEKLEMEFRDLNMLRAKNKIPKLPFKS